MEKRTILYIEDDPASRRLVTRFLLHAGYHVLTAASGLQGIDVVRESLPDLVLTDINLPDMTGHEIASTLRGEERFRTLPIVALTALGYGGQRDIAMAAGISGYLSKPLNMEKLRENIEFYLNGGQEQIDPDRLSAAQTQYIKEIATRSEARIRQLEEAHEDLLKLDRMKETFIEITAHELRTPLTLVVGYIHLLQEYPLMVNMMQGDLGLYNLMNGLMGSMERLQMVVNEILTISRIMSNQIEMSIAPLDLGGVAQKVVAFYAPVLEERRLTLHFNRDEWPSNMLADGELLRLVIHNLMGNAIKYTPDDGHIILGAQVANGQVGFYVQDTGIGIDPADQTHIFERFNTGAQQVELHSSGKTTFGGGGLGLGLSICKGIIEAHSGHIWVESPGRNPESCPGSKFTVTLPLSPSRPDEA